MIRYGWQELSASSAAALAQYQASVNSEPNFPDRVKVAVTEFGRRNKAANPAFLEVRQVLGQMCAGAIRCMYCEDSMADEVEHHHPKTLYPERAFDWANYLYACGPCNGPKGNQFAVVGPDESVQEVRQQRGVPPVPPPPGTSALVDPRREDPLVHMELDLRDTFCFVPAGEEGSLSYRRAQYTIQILRLNSRTFLSRARREAYENYRARVVEYAALKDGGAPHGDLQRLTDAVSRMQHPTVWREMKRQAPLLAELRGLFERVPEALQWG